MNCFPVTPRVLAAIGVPQQRIDRFLLPLNDAMREFNITDGPEPAMFIAQAAHETALFRYLAEIWGPTPQQRKYDDGGPLAQRLGNPPGSGFLNRGFGIFQTTGLYNITAESKHFGVPMDDVRGWLQTPIGACRSAAHYWVKHGCPALAQAYDFVGVTKAINGGTTGLEERTKLYEILSS